MCPYVLVCYMYVVLVTIVRKIMVIKLSVYISYWNDQQISLVDLQENCFSARANSARGEIAYFERMM